MRRLILGLLGVVFAVTPASAHPQTTLDRDDTPGRLDLVAGKQAESFVLQSHPQRSWMVLDMKLVTFQAWNDGHLADPYNFLGFELNLDSDDNMERCVLIQQRETGSGPPEVQATAYRRCSEMPREQMGEPFRVRRPDDHTVLLSIRKRFLIGKNGSYEWRGVSSYQDPQQGPPSDCEHRVYMPPGPLYASCVDFTRWKTHRL